MSAYPHKGIAWSQKEKSRAASRPKPNKNRISYIPQSLRGFGIFLFDRLFSFLRALPIIRQKPTAERTRLLVCALLLCREMRFSGISLRDKPSMLQRAAVRLDFFLKFRRNGGTQRGRWQKKNMDSRPIYRGHG